MFGKFRNQELEKIKEEIKHSGTLSVIMMESIKKAFFEGGNDLCDDVTKDLEVKMNENDNQIEKHCIRFLALYSPKAKLLRTVIMYLEINQNLERIGDLCCGIADSIKVYNFKDNLTKELKFFHILFSQTLSILINANKCVHNEDVFEAMDVINKDKEINDSYYSTTAKILEMFKKNPKKSIRVYELLKILQRLERIGDHSKNIAEEAVYLTEGRVLRH